MFESFNFLIVGKSGSGKSATIRFLTGNQEIDSKNSPNSVTRSIAFYQSTAERKIETKVNINVLDIPGLDQIGHRKTIRQTIFNQLKKRKLQIHAILYTIDAVARDTVNNKKIFHFLNELPWSQREVKELLVPLITKYDNLIFDAQDQNTQKALHQFANIFSENGYIQSWKSNVQYWVNDTKNVDKKMNIYQSIRQVYENQIQNLIRLIRKKKSTLTYLKIEQFIQQQRKHVDNKIVQLIKYRQIPLQASTYTICHNLKIQLANKLNMKSFAAFTVGSVGVILSRIVKNEILKGVLALTSMLTSGLIITNFMKQHEEVEAKKQKQLHMLQLLYPQNYLIIKLNQLILLKFEQFQKKLQFKINGNQLKVKISEDFDGQYFIIENVQCYFQSQKMTKQPEGTIFSYKLEDTHSKILQADLRMQLFLRVPHESSLLLKFEQQSNKFKQVYDKR